MTALWFSLIRLFALVFPAARYHSGSLPPARWINRSYQKLSVNMPQALCASITPGKCALRRFTRGRPAQPSLSKFGSPWMRPPPRKEIIWLGAKRGCRNCRAGLPCLTLSGTPCRSDWALPLGWRETNGAWALWPKLKSRFASTWKHI